MVTPDSGTSLSTMPKWAFTKFEKATYPKRSPCGLDSEQSFDDLVFVINGVDYPIPSHHWNERTIDNSEELGGLCSHTISELTI